MSQDHNSQNNTGINPSVSQAQTQKIRMEGTHYGIRITMPDTPDQTDETLMDLLTRIPDGAYKLPDGQGVALNFQSRACSRDFLLSFMRNVVWLKKIHVIAWLSSNQKSLELFRSSGFCTKEPEERKPEPANDKAEKAEAHDSEPEQEQEAIAEPEVAGIKIVLNSMRSGQRVEAPGDVLLWGHLNSGAEILAGGSVVVAGRLKGLVHAGYGGREDVAVMAGSFEARQVRLGHKICYADSKTVGWGKSILIALEDRAAIVWENTFMPPPSRERERDRERERTRNTPRA